VKSFCPQLSGFRRCNHCGREGHFGKDCPTLRRAVARPSSHTPIQTQQRRGGGRPQATGRVYVMTRLEAAGAGNLVIGCCVIFVKACCVLFDSGATHSFVSESCVRELGLPVYKLQFDLVVYTLASRLVRTSTVCARCPVEVEGRVYKVNLICLTLQGLDVILGMDWLSANRVLIDCREKKLLFSNS